jgi:hypothetical protein
MEKTMSEAFDSIKQGLTEAIEFAKGNQIKQLFTILMQLMLKNQCKYEYESIRICVNFWNQSWHTPALGKRRSKTSRYYTGVIDNSRKKTKGSFGSTFPIIITMITQDLIHKKILVNHH